MVHQRKPVYFMPPTRTDIRTLPEDVEDAFGSAILDAQYGDFPSGARPFGEGMPSKILKLREDEGGNTYRLSFWLGCPQAVYVLDILMKKSTSGISTPQHDKIRILGRYQAARKHCEETYGTTRKERR